jgi:hypothetical protein
MRSMWRVLALAVAAPLMLATAAPAQGPEGAG